MDNALAMSNKDVAVLILAAGKGTRLKSGFAKVLHQAGGRPIVDQVVHACLPLHARKIVAVVGHQAEQVSALVRPLGVETVLQQPQNGTGHALLVSKRAIGNAKFVVVLPGDAPLIRTETLRALVGKHKSGNAAATILTAVLADPSGYGRILRKSGDTVAAIIEESKLSPEQRELNEINSSIYCFTSARLWPALVQVKPDNQQMIHRIRKIGIAVKGVNQKNSTILVESSCHPNGKCNADDEIAEVAGCNIHMLLPLSSIF